MKSIFSFWAIYMIAFFISAQSPFQVSQYRCWGGNNADIFYVLKPYNSQIFMLGGSTKSTSGFISGSYGDWDGFVSFFDHQLNPLKSVVIGGNHRDEVKDLIVTELGTILLLHSSQSTNGNYSGNHGEKDACLQPYDFQSEWLGQLKLFGGSFDDELFSISKKTAGGYLLAGYSMSSDGHLTNNYGSADAWILNLSSTLNVNWSRSYGGSNYDYFTNVFQFPDGNIIAVGNTYSNDVMIHNNKGGKDVWIVKLNSMGDTIWTKTIGGSHYDEVVQARLLNDSTVILFGYTSSSDGDFVIVSAHGRVTSYQGFIYVFDKNGEMLFKALLSHSTDDYFYTDGFGTTNQSYIATGLHSNQFTLTAILSEIHSNNIHTSDFDYGISDHVVKVLQLEDSVLVMSCITSSPTIPQFQGLYDILLLKVKYTTADIHHFNFNNFTIYPNPAHDFIYVNLSNDLLPCEYVIHSMDGKIITHGYLNTERCIFPISDLSAGQYFLSIQSSSVSMTRPFMKY